MRGVCNFDLLVKRDRVDCGSKGFDCIMWRQLGFFKSLYLFVGLIHMVISYGILFY